MTTFIQFAGGNRVGLVVRGKTSATHDPSVFAQHADCILSNGAPIGFFGEGNAGSSGQAPSGSGASSRKSAASSQSTGFGMSGVVFDAGLLAQRRANYISQQVARSTGTVSTVLLVDVSEAEAKAFDDAWARMKANPGSFHLLGWNCSTHASQAFREAGILAGGIPGLDTPNNLYKQLAFEKKGKVTSYSGYVGFGSIGAGWMLIIDEVGP